MTPTIVRKDGRVELVLGSPGGPRIITAVTGVIVRVLVYEQSLGERSPRRASISSGARPRRGSKPGWPGADGRGLARAPDIALEVSRAALGERAGDPVHGWARRGLPAIRAAAECRRSQGVSGSARLG
jgi:hypothetical protein